MPDAPKRVAMIGAGKVSRHLATWLKGSGVEIVQVINRTAGNAKGLAESLDAKVGSDPRELDASVEMVVIAVSDDAIAAVSEALPKRDMLVVHTSGTRSLDDLKRHQKRGVFYPLQTFTQQADIDFQRIPICIEGNNSETDDILHACCIEWRMHCYRLNSSQRATLHVAAVITNNFTNYLWGRAYDLLESESIDADILHPLMLETVRKATRYKPHDVQTGPAVRDDQETIRRHLEYLAADEKLRDIYRLITEQITAKHSDGEL